MTFKGREGVTGIDLQGERVGVQGWPSRGGRRLQVLLAFKGRRGGGVKGTEMAFKGGGYRDGLQGGGGGGGGEVGLLVTMNFFLFFVGMSYCLSISYHIFPPSCLLWLGSSTRC